MDSAQWYIHDCGRTYGPVTVETAAAWAQQGLLTAAAQMAQPGDKTWRRADKILGAPIVPPSAAQPGADLEAYEAIAETIGMMPSLRKEDTVFQAKCAGGAAVLGVAVGLGIAAVQPQRDGTMLLIGAALGLVAGLLIGTFISGAIIGVRGLRRAARR